MLTFRTVIVSVIPVAPTNRRRSRAILSCASESVTAFREKERGGEVLHLPRREQERSGAVRLISKRERYWVSSATGLRPLADVTKVIAKTERRAFEDRQHRMDGTKARNTSRSPHGVVDDRGDVTDARTVGRGGPRTHPTRPVSRCHPHCRRSKQHRPTTSISRPHSIGSKAIARPGRLHPSSQPSTSARSNRT